MKPENDSWLTDIKTEIAIQNSRMLKVFIAFLMLLIVGGYILVQVVLR